MFVRKIHTRLRRPDKQVVAATQSQLPSKKSGVWKIATAPAVDNAAQSVHPLCLSGLGRLVWVWFYGSRWPIPRVKIQFTTELRRGRRREVIVC
jgi:hypothetical protein